MRGTYQIRWQPGNRKTKYGAKSTVYNNRRYDSKREAKYAEDLDWMIKADKLKEVTPQFQLGIYIGGRLWATWKVDFMVILPDGEMELREIKGFETTDYVQKRNAFLCVQASDCECNYITNYKNGDKLEKTVKLIVIK